MARQQLSQRLAALLARPGMDTRFWLKLALVDRVVVDPAEGVLADITLLPDEEPETAFVCSPYAGGGFGFHFPLEVDDMVLVAMPDGDCNQGCMIIGRTWDAGDPPFPEMSSDTPAEEADGNDPTPDVVLRAKPGANTRIIVSAGANVTITVEGEGNVNLVVNSGSVNLGADSHAATEGVVQGEAFDSFTGQTQTALGNASSKVFAKKS